MEGNPEDFQQTEIQELLEKIRTLTAVQICLNEIKSGSVIFEFESHLQGLIDIQDKFESGQLEAITKQSILEVKRIDDVDFEALYELAHELYEAGEYSDAVSCVNRVIENEPNNIDAWILKTSSLLYLYKITEEGHGDLILKRALSCARYTINLDPENPLVIAQEATVLCEIDSEEALEIVEKALSIDETIGLIWWNKSAILQRLGRLEESVAALETAIRLGEKRAVNDLKAVLAELNRRH
jgi:tetratricopeptide (TPR) repeat protein